jgi:hypothetical protein
MPRFTFRSYLFRPMFMACLLRACTVLVVAIDTEFLPIPLSFATTIIELSSRIMESALRIQLEIHAPD